MSSRNAGVALLTRKIAGNPLLAQSVLDAIEKRRCEESFEFFVEKAWPYVDPTPFSPGWHITAICLHLEAVTHGEIRNLVINIPPRHGKSLIVSVLWPAWVWIQQDRFNDDGVKSPVCGNSTRFLCASYIDRLSTRDNVKTRNLIESAWYQKHWGDRVQIRPGENNKTRYDFVSGGFRISTSVQGMSTGEGGDVIIMDDPLSAKEAASPTIREEREFWFTEVMPSRLNDRKRSARVIVQQRLHERDTTGIIIAKQLPYVILCLPAYYEPDHPLVWEGDPRTEPGELLWEDRFDAESMAELCKDMTEYAVAGQLQQRPAPREGGLFKRANLEIVDAAPPYVERVRAWDFAATEKSITSPNPAYTAGLRMILGIDGVFYIDAVERDRYTPGQLSKTLRNIASQDGRRTRIRIPQDPGQSGKAQAHAYIKLLAGYVVRAKPVSGSKVQRAEPLAAQVEAGNVKLVKGAWNEAFIEEAITFPNGAFKDQIDAAADAFDELTHKKGGTATTITGAW